MNRPQPPESTETNRWWLVLGAALAVFMASVDMSIVNIALPAIEADLGIATSSTQWVVLAYLLPLAGLALPSGRWLDHVGQRAALAFSITGFAVASLAAGLAADLVWLVGARLVQGAFGALLFSLVPALVTAAVRSEARGRAMAVITTVGPLGLISGPALGGLVVESLGWAWVFFVNLPVSALVLVVCLRNVTRSGALKAPDRAWLAEAVVLCAAITAILAGLTMSVADGAAWLALALLAVPLLALWSRTPASVEVRSLLRLPGARAPHLSLALSATAIGIVFFVTPYFLQWQLEVTVAAAGATVLWFPVGMALTGPIGGFLADWWGQQRAALVGAGLFASGLLLLLPMSTEWDTVDVGWRLLVAGCGSGLFNAPNMVIAMSHAPRSLMATMGASIGLARTLGFALGPALATIVLSVTDVGGNGYRGTIAVAAACSVLAIVALAGRLSVTPPSQVGESRGSPPLPGVWSNRLSSHS